MSIPSLPPLFSTPAVSTAGNAQPNAPAAPRDAQAETGQAVKVRPREQAGAGGLEAWTKAGNKKQAAQAPAISSAPRLSTASSSQMASSSSSASSVASTSASQPVTRTPQERLMKAIAKGDLEQLRAAIKNGADLNAIPNGKLLSPLTAAVLKQNENIVSELRKSGADLDQPDGSGKTALATAISIKKPRMVELLLAPVKNAEGKQVPGADPNKADKDSNKIPLLLAMNSCNGEIQKAVYGAKNFKLPKEQINEALNHAVQNRSPTLLLPLLRLAEANDAKVSNPKALLQLGIEFGNVAVARFVIENGLVEINDFIAGPEVKRSALMLASFEGSTDMIELLLNMGADVNLVNNDNETALMYAVRADKKEAVKMLVMGHGADAHIKTKYGKTALHFAVEQNSLTTNTHAIIEWLKMVE
jgi:ankyrin repeat protein